MKIGKIIGIILGSMIIWLVSYLIYGSTNPPKSVFIDEITVFDNKINFKGEVAVGSANVYRGYNVSYKDKLLYIKIRLGSVLGSIVPFLHLQESPNFAISIDKNKYGLIKEIYLQGDTPSENVLIWSKK